MTGLTVPTTSVIKSIRNFYFVLVTRFLIAFDKVFLDTSASDCPLKLRIKVSDFPILIGANLLPVKPLPVLHVRDDGVSRGSVMGPALKLEREVVHVIEGDALEVVDELGVGGLYELWTRATCLLTTRGHQQTVERVGEHVDGVSDKVDVRLLHLRI